VICQSIIPGILTGDQSSKQVYGAIGISFPFLTIFQKKEKHFQKIKSIMNYSLKLERE
jgi:hypothetical protein